ncbi:IS3 family transposase, partial [Legionella sp.]|uniref:IS3 family transposase n=1 Tax=Legionella sp. TaxID=459 RepID=UPI003CC51E43
LKGHKTPNELASEFEVHPTQINQWKRLLLESSKHLFSGKNENEKDVESLEKEREKLYTQIGQYLLQSLTIAQPNQVWCADLTYIRMYGGFVYLVTIMDWYSRKVLSWEVPNTMDDSFCVSALESAIRRYGAPGIFNTDQGSQFTGKVFINVLQDHDIQISMDRKGCWVDNVFIERLWRSVKYEDVYLKEYPTVLALRHGLREYFRFYNDEKPHESLGKCTPSECYDGLRVAA